MNPGEVNLFVHAVTDDGRILKVGRFLSRNLLPAQRGGREGFFAYDPDWLNSSEKFPIDPVNLPLSGRIYPANRPEEGIHGVFSDCLPGAWGEKLLARKAGIHTGHYAPAHLLTALGAGGLGALLFSGESIPPRAIENTSLDFNDLAKALAEAKDYERSLDPVELKYLASSGYSAGGARPKVLVRMAGEHFLAKFSSVHDRNHSLNVQLETAGLTLGKRAGLDIPDFQVKKVRQRPVLLVKRFDVSPKGGRRGLISFRTLLSCYDDPGRISYGNLAEVLRMVSCSPQRDLENLFRQMVLNILIINTDDHLQNFSMLHDAEGWRLSPAYDLVPNLWRDEQVLMVDSRYSGLSLDNVVAEGRRFGLQKKKAQGLVEEVVAAMRGWRELFTHAGMAARIEGRMQRFLGA